MYQIQQLGLGGVLDQAINVMKQKFGLLMSIVLVTIVPMQMIGGLAQLILVPGAVAGMGGITAPTGDPMQLLMFSGFFGLLYLLFLPLANAAVIHGVASEYLSRPTTLGECLRHGASRWPALVWTLILQALVLMGVVIVCMIPVFILAMVLPGILVGIITVVIILVAMFYFLMWYLLAQQVAVLEPRSGSAALSRSKSLMQDNKLTGFGLTLIMAVIGAAAGFVTAFIPQSHAMVIVQSLVNGVMTVFGSCVLVILYFSCRCKAENFDLQVLADAVAEEE